MDEIMDVIHEYVSLFARVASGEALVPSDRAQWLALSRLIPDNGDAPEPGDDDEQEGIPVQITTPGGFDSAHLLAISREGMRICLARPLGLGASTIVRIIAPRTGLEYTFPCKVTWMSDGMIGLAFDGMPGKTPLSKALLVGWRRPLDLRIGWGGSSKPTIAMA
jgi:hypothetical protein